MAAVKVRSQNTKDSAVWDRGLKTVTNDSKLPVVPGSKPAHGKPSSRQSPPCSRTERRPFVRDVSPLASRKQQEERVGRTSPFVARLPSRSATIPMRKKDLEMKTRSPRAVRKLEPLNHKPIPKSLEEGDATKSGIERVGYPLKKGSTLPAIQLSCPAIIVTDTDSMPPIERHKEMALEKSASQPDLVSC